MILGNQKTGVQMTKWNLTKMSVSVESKSYYPGALILPVWTSQALFVISCMRNSFHMIILGAPLCTSLSLKSVFLHMCNQNYTQCSKEHFTSDFYSSNNASLSLLEIPPLMTCWKMCIYMPFFSVTVCPVRTSISPSPSQAGLHWVRCCTNPCLD